MLAKSTTRAKWFLLFGLLWQFNLQGHDASAQTLPRTIPELVESLDSYIPQFLLDHNVPGFQISLAIGDTIVYSRGFTNPAIAMPPVNDTTIMQYGSNSKRITAAMLLQSFQNKGITLSRLGSSFFENPMWDPIAKGDPTVDDILAHIGGFSTETEVIPYDSSSYAPLQDWLRGRLILQYDPGSAYHYSNTGYGLLGAIVEQTEGLEFNQAFHKLVGNPLSMRSTSFDREDLPIDRLSPNFQYSTLLPSNRVRPVPSSGLYSCSLDMCRFNMAIRDGGSLHGHQVLDPSIGSLMEEPRVQTDTALGYWYGRGTELHYDVMAPGIRLYEHQGWANNFYSRTGYTKYPRSSYAWAMNSYNEQTIDQGIFARLSNVLKCLYDEKPTYSKIPKLFACAGEKYVGTICVVDGDSRRWWDAAKIILLDGPSWMAVDSVSGTIVALPSAADTGTFSFSVRASDKFGGISDTTLLLTVRPPNRPPFFVRTDFPVAVEDSVWSYALQFGDLDTAYGDSLRFRACFLPAWMVLDSVLGIVHGTPAGASVRDSIARIIVVDALGSSDTLTVSLSILHRNHFPRIRGVLFQTTVIGDASTQCVVAEDSLLQIRVLASDPDSALFGDRLTYHLGLHPVWLGIDSVTGKITGTPGPQHLGKTTFEAIVDDGVGGMTSKPFAITVVHVNRPPVFSAIPPVVFAEDSSAWLSLRAFVADSDNAGQPISISSRLGDSTLSPHLAVALDTVTATAQFTASPNFNGTHLPVIVTATDILGTSSTDTLFVTITPVNDPPRFSRQDTVKLRESDSLFVPFTAFYGSVTDPDDADSTLLWKVSGGSHVHFRESTTGIMVKPTRYWNGTELLTLKAADTLGLADSTRLVVVVTFVDDPPVLAALAPITFKADSCYVLWLSKYLADPDDSVASLFWSATMPDYQQTVELSPEPAGSGGGNERSIKTPADSLHMAYDIASGTISFTASPHFSCENLRVVIHAKDEESATSDTVLVTVLHVNVAPVIAGIPDTLACLGKRYVFHVGASDPDDSVLTYSVQGPAWLRVDSTGTVQGVPQEAGSFPVMVIAKDPHGLSDTLRYPLCVTILKSVADEETGIPRDYVMHQNYPNPFNPSTTIRFGVPERSRVQMEVFNMAGQCVQTLMMSDCDAGYHSFAWHPTQLSSGAYVIVLNAKGLVTPGRDVRVVKKAVLLK
jgi:CubicO group peptidase (beta-lactamase class C family)